MIRLIFTADNHISKPYPRMTPDQLARRREWLRRTWIQTVDYALENQVDFYLHGGDLFDTPQPRFADATVVAQHLA